LKFHPFAALSFRPYRLWFLGQLASLTGTWMQATAQAYLVYQLTGSAAYLGYVGFASGAPAALGLFGGVVSDRMSRRTLLLITQTSMMLLAGILSALTYSGIVQPWHIIVLAALLGAANAFDAPARQSFVSELVDREHLTNGIAINSLMFNLARALGPAAAGLVYAARGPGFCFLVNALSFIAVIGALAAIRTPPQQKAPRASMAAQMKEGVRFAFADPVIRSILLTVGMVAVFGLGYITLIPAWTVRMLHGDARDVGFLQGAQGLGALFGSLAIAFLGSRGPRGRMLLSGVAIFPFAVFGFAWAPTVPLSALFLVAGGFFVMFVFNLANAIVQTIVPDYLRGRVMSVYTLCFLGTMPLGSLAAGWIAEWKGELFAVIAGGTVLTLFGITMWTAAPLLRARA
jgi:MFS family permease